MKKFQGFNLGRAGRCLKRGWAKNNQKILALAAAGFAVGAVIEAIKATPRATQIKEDRLSDLDSLATRLQAEEISAEEYQKATREVNLRTAKEYTLCYTKTGILLILSLGSIASNYEISIGREAALLGAYKALEARSDGFVDKAKEIVGEKKVEEIKTAVVKDHLDNADIPERIKAQEYEMDKDGKFVAKAYAYPCWEDQSGRPFVSSVSRIDIAMQKASAKCYSNGSITLNEIYEFLDPNGLDLPANGFGETHGFIDRQLNMDKLIPYFTRPIDRDGFDHSFTALIFEEEPVLIKWDESCY